MEGEAERLAKRLAPRLPNETPKDKPGLRLIGEVNGSTEGNEAGTGKPGLQKLAEVDRKKPTIEEIYAAYPKKSAWGEAMKEIAAAIEGGADPKMLMERVKTFAAAVALWSREYRFNREGRDVCPNASTWFKQHRWKDDTETWLPQGGGKIETRRQKMLREAEEEAKRREAQA